MVGPPWAVSHRSSTWGSAASDTPHVQDVGYGCQQLRFAAETIVQGDPARERLLWQCIETLLHLRDDALAATVSIVSIPVVP